MMMLMMMMMIMIYDPLKLTTTVILVAVLASLYEVIILSNIHGLSLASTIPMCVWVCHSVANVNMK
jgi:hypothetical protein